MQMHRPELHLPLHLDAVLHCVQCGTGTIGTHVHGNLHAVYASSSLAQPCITIFPKKRFGCSVCPLNPKSDDGLRACGDGYVNTWSHMGSRIHQGSFREQALGLPFDEAAFATFTAGNQRRRRYEWRAAPAATCLAAYGSPGPRARATYHIPTLSTNRHGPKGRSQALKRKAVAAARI